jgi:hypothetical protein
MTYVLLDILDTREEAELEDCWKADCPAIAGWIEAREVYGAGCEGVYVPAIEYG